MASKLITLASHEAPNLFELSLRECFNLHQPKLNPPLKLILPSPSEYLTLNGAISYGVLCEPLVATTYIKHLHGIVNDGYALFVELLVQIVNEFYPKLLDTAKKQLIWVTSIVVDVAGLGFQNLLESIMRQIVGGDLSDGNLWLSFELVNLILLKWDSILDEEPDALISALYVYLRLLSDHYRLPNSTKYKELKQKEIEFCLKSLSEQFGLCTKLGRDLIRLLQDLFHIPEFRGFWKTLMLEPSLLKAPGFSDIRDLYRLRTSSRYFLLRVTPEMEIQLRFLLTSVKFRSSRRHQAWFETKFFCVPERETLICDIVRFICCAHHPSNEGIQSDIIPRWAVIGWLLKCCTKKYVEANVKLALFFDWLFFDEKVDMVMDIEPVMLLMLNSIPRYVDITQSLLEFLILLVEKYDVDRTSFILQGVSSAFRMLVQKGGVHSIDVLISCEALSPFKEKLKIFLSKTKSVFSEQVLADKLSKLNSTQQCIEKLSHWCIFHQSKAEVVVATWIKQFQNSQLSQKIPLLYLANEILQNSKCKGNEFVTEFWKVLPEAIKDVAENGDERGKNVATRLVEIRDERKVFGSRARNIKDVMLGGELPPPLGLGKKRPRSVKIMKRDSRSIKTKLSIGGPAEKIVSAFHSVLSDHSSEDAEMSQCNSAVSHVSKMEQDVDSACRHAKDPRRKTLAVKLEEEENILKQCLEKLKAFEANRVVLVTQLKEALQEQESELENVHTLMELAQAQSEAVSEMKKQLSDENYITPPTSNGVSKSKTTADMAAEVVDKLTASSSSQLIMSSVLSSFAAEAAKNAVRSTPNNNSFPKPDNAQIPAPMPSTNPYQTVLVPQQTLQSQSPGGQSPYQLLSNVSTQNYPQPPPQQPSGGMQNAYGFSALPPLPPGPPPPLMPPLQQQLQMTQQQQPAVLVQQQQPMMSLPQQPMMSAPPGFRPLQPPGMVYYTHLPNSH